MQCLILAGGLATRMRPFTEEIPKALIPIHSKPFLYYQLRWLAHTGVKDVVLSIGYRGQKIRDYAGDGSRWNLKIQYVDEGAELRGTGGALRVAFDAGALQERFLITYGDTLLPVDFSSVWRAFLVSGAPALLAVLKNSGQWDVSNSCFENGKITYHDKRKRTPPPGPVEYIDYGLSVLERRLVEQRIASGAKLDLSDLFQELCREEKLAGFEVFERFHEIGSPEGLQEFEKWIKTTEL